MDALDPPELDRCARTFVLRRRRTSRGVPPPGSANKLQRRCHPRSVIAPMLAVDTSFMYLASTPRVYLGAGGFQHARRRESSASLTLSSTSSLWASIVIGSPSSIRAMFPPTYASGAT